MTPDDHTALAEQVAQLRIWADDAERRATRYPHLAGACRNHARICRDAADRVLAVVDRVEVIEHVRRVGKGS